MREAHDARRQALLLAVELADLDLGADLGMGDVEPRKRDGLASSIGERVALVTTPTWARPTWTQSPWPTASLPSISRPTSLCCGCSLRRISASRPMKSSVFDLQRHGEADAGLERVGLVGEFVTGEDQARPRCAPCRAPAGPSASARAAAPASQIASNTVSASFGWQKIS